jgi:hypothetical protein
MVEELAQAHIVNAKAKNSILGNLAPAPSP